MSSALDRFVGDDELRLERERACHRDALPLTARELRREPAEVRGAHPDLLEQRDDLLLPLLAGQVEVHLERLADDVGHGGQRIEGRVGILEHHLHVATSLAELVALQREDVATVQLDRTRSRLDETQHESTGRRLARPALADEAEDLTATDVEAHTVDGAHVRDRLAHQALLDREDLLEVAYPEQRRVRRFEARLRGAAATAARPSPRGLGRHVGVADAAHDAPVGEPFDGGRRRRALLDHVRAAGCEPAADREPARHRDRARRSCAAARPSPPTAASSRAGRRCRGGAARRRSRRPAPARRPDRRT